MRDDTFIYDNLAVDVSVEVLPLREPFRISGYVMDTADLLVVTLGKDGAHGRGEAAGVYYRGEDPTSMATAIEAVRAYIERGISRAILQALLPPGGARNAIDCALWGLESALTGMPVWQLAGLAPPHRLLTTFTCGVDVPEKMASVAIGYAQALAIKVKLSGDQQDGERIRAIRKARPDVWLGVDANQGFTRASLEALLPVLVGADVKLIEQPFPIGKEGWIDGLHCPIPVAADESVQGIGDLEKVAGRFDVVNIKLDKCGGLTEALAMAKEARARGLDVMVGNMIGTSLSMAPAYLVGQLCDIVDLDGPIFLENDRANSVRYENGMIDCPDFVWNT